MARRERFPAQPQEIFSSDKGACQIIDALVQALSPSSAVPQENHHHQQKQERPPPPEQQDESGDGRRRRLQVVWAEQLLLRGSHC